ncbi:MAG: hypothetical protein R2851_05450 [Caldilineaceae bacterium]
MTRTAITHQQTYSHSWWSRNQRRVIPYLFITPMMLIFITFVFLPISYAAAMSFFNWNGISSPEFIGIENYVDIFTDPVFWIALKNTVIYSPRGPRQRGLGVVGSHWPEPQEPPRAADFPHHLFLALRYFSSHCDDSRLDFW